MLECPSLRSSKKRWELEGSWACSGFRRGEATIVKVPRLVSLKIGSFIKRLLGTKVRQDAFCECRFIGNAISILSSEATSASLSTVFQFWGEISHQFCGAPRRLLHFRPVSHSWTACLSQLPFQPWRELGSLQMFSSQPTGNLLTDRSSCWCHQRHSWHQLKCLAQQNCNPALLRTLLKGTLRAY